MKRARPHLLTEEEFKHDRRGRFWEIPVPDRTGVLLKVHEVGWMRPKGTEPERPKRRYVRVRAVWMRQTGKRFKVILLEELKFRNGRRELRFCYWTTTGLKNKVWKGVWWWGESALMAPRDDIARLLRFAARKGLVPLGEAS